MDSNKIEIRLSRIEELLEQLLTASQPGADELLNEIAIVRAQGKDLATHFKEKARAKMRLDRQARKRSQA